MKRVLCLILSAVLLLGLAACGGKKTEVKTWQEQYDLGIRYLSEGNYQEAILAFNAAIQIDPKQTVIYEKLAEAYTQSGDAETAAKILSDGIAVTGSDALKALLEQMQASLLPQPTPEPVPENTGSPAEMPELPEVLLSRLNGIYMDYGKGLIYYEQNDYHPFGPKWANAMKPLLAAGVSGDADTLQAELEKVNWAWVQENFADFAGVQDYGQYQYLMFWTVWNGDLLNVDFRFENYVMSSLSMEYRPAEGKGFSAGLSAGGYVYYIVGGMKDWLYDGAFEIYQQQWDVNPGTNHTTGYASAERIHGELVNENWDAELNMTEINSYVLEDGHFTNAFTDPDNGELCYRKIERVLPDGTRRTIYGSADQERLDFINYVCRNVA